jgi:hypothetical protein
MSYLLLIVDLASFCFILEVESEFSAFFAERTIG